jgi:hypothetical protein
MLLKLNELWLSSMTGHLPWERWSAGECVGGALGQRLGSDFLPGDALDDMFLREMSLLEPMPSLTGAF